MPNEIELVILCILVWLYGFFSGRISNAKKALDDIRECRAGLERVKEIHKQYEESTENLIEHLMSENTQLKLQLEMYRHRNDTKGESE